MQALALARPGAVALVGIEAEHDEARHLFDLQPPHAVSDRTSQRIEGRGDPISPIRVDGPH